MTRRKKSARKRTKDRLWKAMSKYVRLRDANNETVSCVTCGATGNYKSFHAGHFIPQAQGDAVRYHPYNAHNQCFRCNINLGGNGAEYYPFMVSRYSEEFVDHLRYMSNQTVKYSLAELEEMAELYEWLADNVGQG